MSPTNKAKQTKKMLYKERILRLPTDREILERYIHVWICVSTQGKAYQSKGQRLSLRIHLSDR